MAKMAERFGKAKRVDRDLPGASAQGGGDFSGQKCSRGPGDKHLAAASIEQSPYEAFPARHDLDLVKAPGNDSLLGKFREATAVLINQETELVPLQVPQGDFSEPGRLLPRWSLGI